MVLGKLENEVLENYHQTIVNRVEADESVVQTNVLRLLKRMTAPTIRHHAGVLVALAVDPATKPRVRKQAVALLADRLTGSDLVKYASIIVCAFHLGVVRHLNVLDQDAHLGIEATSEGTADEGEDEIDSSSAMEEICQLLTLLPPTTLTPHVATLCAGLLPSIGPRNAAILRTCDEVRYHALSMCLAHRLVHKAWRNCRTERLLCVGRCCARSLRTPTASP